MSAGVAFMPALTLLVVSVALADSINPSTVVPALWIAGSPKPHLLSFAFGAFAVYLTGGLVLLLGPGPALIRGLHHLQGPFEHATEAAAGVAVLVLALWLWRSRHSHQVTRLPAPGAARRSAFLLGAGIMAVELPTAFMYFGAISAVLAAHATRVTGVSLLVVYNALFVSPILAMIAVRRIAGARAELWLASAWKRLVGLGQVLLAGLTGSAGVALLVVGVTGLFVT